MEEFAIKVSPFDGSTAGELSEGRMRACGWGWYEPILVGGLTYIGRWYVPILVTTRTYIGQPADQYRLLSRVKQ